MSNEWSKVFIISIICIRYLHCSFFINALEFRFQLAIICIHFDRPLFARSTHTYKRRLYIIKQLHWSVYKYMFVLELPTFVHKSCCMTNSVRITMFQKVWSSLVTFSGSSGRFVFHSFTSCFISLTMTRTIWFSAVAFSCPWLRAQSFRTLPPCYK